MNYETNTSNSLDELEEKFTLRDDIVWIYARAGDRVWVLPVKNAKYLEELLKNNSKKILSASDHLWEDILPSGFSYLSYDDPSDIDFYVEYYEIEV